LVLWLDCDREGEAIAYEVIDVCKKKNPRIQVHRAHFSTLQQREVKNAMMNLRRPNQQFADAVRARQEIDLRLGAVFTRFQTTRLRDRYDLPDIGHGSNVISYGPCQFPTLGFIVDRYLRREKFVAEPFWGIEVVYTQQDENSGGGRPSSIMFKWARDRLFDRMITIIFYEQILENPVARVIKVDGRGTTKHRPFPMATIELQKRASNWLRIGSEETMKIAEKLYTTGFISYPRTETDKFKKDYDLATLIQDQCNHSQWGRFAQDLQRGPAPQGKFLFPKEGGHDDNAHPPIHPIKCAEPGSFSCPKEQKVYELVVRHFLACCSMDAVGSQKNVTIDMNGELFTATGKQVVERNYLEVYPYEKWYNSTIPALEEGDTFTPTSVEMKEGSTQAPQLLSEAELLGMMDTNGIGTDATMAAHIANIQSRGYTVKEEDSGMARFRPLDLGLALVESYDVMGYDGFAKPLLRAQMERDCELVANNRKQPGEVVNDVLRTFKEIYKIVSARGNQSKMHETMRKYFQPGDGGGGAGGRGGVDLSQLDIQRCVKAKFSKCGTCNGDMRLVLLLPPDRGGGQNQNGNNDDGVREPYRALQCDRCETRHRLPGPKKSKIVVAFDFRCPLCKFQVVEMKKDANTSGYKLCPQCYNVPPPAVKGPPNDQDMEDIGRGNVPCFKCCNTVCPLAPAPEHALSKCPQCQTHDLYLKKKKDGGFMVSCKGYPDCKSVAWVPGNIKEASTSAAHKCTRCSRRGKDYHLLTIKGRLGPGMPNPYTGCLVCDEDGLFNNLGLVITAAPGSQQQQQQQRGGGGGGFGRNGGGGNGSSNRAPPQFQNQNQNQNQNRRQQQPQQGGRLHNQNGHQNRGDHGQHQQQQRHTQNHQNQQHQNQNQGAQGGDVMCKCNLPVPQFTVKKDGPNQGRKFLKCKTCDFFEWCD
jgi:DNA topoisomerase-3